MRKYTMQQAHKYLTSGALMRAGFLSVITLLCFFSSLMMAQDIFPGWVLSAKAARWLYGTVIFTVVLYEIGIGAVPYRLRVLCRLVVSAIYVLAGSSYWKEHRIDLEDGACALATEYFQKFNSHLKTSVSIWRGKEEFLGLALAFWGLAILFMLMMIAQLLCRRGVLLLLPAAVFVAELTIGYIPQWKGMALFFTALLFVQADGGNDKKALRVHIDGQQRYRQAWYVPWLSPICLAGISVMILFGSHMLSNATENRLLAAAPNVQAFQKKIEKHFSDLWLGYFTPRQEQVNNQTPHYTGKEMLRITASRRPAEDVLLKGFCGTDYENGSWYCDKQKFSDVCAIAGYGEETAARELLQAQYDLYAQGAERIMMQYAFGGRFMTMKTGENTRTDYTVEHTGVRSRYLFAPYAIDHNPDPNEQKRGIFQNKNQTNEQLVSDVAVHKSFWQDTYTFHGWDHFTGGIDTDTVLQEDKKQVFQWYGRFAKKVYLNTSDRIPSVNEYLGEMMDGQESYRLDELARWDLNAQANINWMMLLQLQEQSDFMGDAYVQNLMRLQTALIVSATLKKYQTYSMELDPLPEGEDPVRYFLMQSRKGYCVHFASAAVLLLRELGVPARYASGYVVRLREFKQKGDVFTASVKDSNAHAWVEIYLEQIGWIPIDVTPGTAIQPQRAEDGSVQKAEDADADEQDTQTDVTDTAADTDTQTQPDTDDTQTQPDENQTSAQDQENRLWVRYRFVFAAVVVLTGILAVFMLCRSLLRLYDRTPLREIHAGKYRTAVKRINGRIYVRLCIRTRSLHQNLTDAQYEQMLKTVYQHIFMEDWTYFMQVVRAAAYAKEEVPLKDAMFCWQIYCNIRKGK